MGPDEVSRANSASFDNETTRGSFIAYVAFSSMIPTNRKFHKNSVKICAIRRCPTRSRTWLLFYALVLLVLNHRFHSSHRPRRSSRSPHPSIIAQLSGCWLIPFLPASNWYTSVDRAHHEDVLGATSVCLNFVTYVQVLFPFPCACLLHAFLSEWARHHRHKSILHLKDLTEPTPQRDEFFVCTYDVYIYILPDHPTDTLS